MKDAYLQNKFAWLLRCTECRVPESHDNKDLRKLRYGFLYKFESYT
jgi:hypothetical protein